MSASIATGAVKPAPTVRRSGQKIRTLPFVAPAVLILLVWMIVPLAMTLYFSAMRYNLLNPVVEFAGIGNYQYLLEDPSLWTSMWNTLVLVGSVLAITVVAGTLLAVLFDQDFPGRGVARLFAIAPFFVMPTVSALIWKNLLMHPINGIFGWFSRVFGFQPVDWFAEYPMTAVIMIVSWQWIPFALLILLTAIQSLDKGLGQFRRQIAVMAL
jgi:sorbitol/mannitol transport system permease protein